MKCHACHVLLLGLACNAYIREGTCFPERMEGGNVACSDWWNTLAIGCTF